MGVKVVGAARAGLFFFLQLAALQSGLSQEAPLPARPDIDQLSVYFNRDPSGRYTDPYRLFDRSGVNVENLWIQKIAQARQRVWLAVYELRVPGIARALAQAKSRGVDVRVVLEDTNNFSLDAMPADSVGPENYMANRLLDYWRYEDSNGDHQLSVAELAQNDAIFILRQAGVPTIDDREDGSVGSGLMHHKFMLVDDADLVTSSGNLTWSDLHGDALKPSTRGNANNTLVIRSALVNEKFAAEFSQLWGDGVGGRKNSRFGVRKTYRAPTQVTLSTGEKITLQFGGTSQVHTYNQSLNGTIQQKLLGARQSVDAALFVWSEQKLSDALQGNRLNRLRVVTEEFFGYRYYSEVLDLLGVQMYSNRCEFEEYNRPWRRPITSAGVSQLQAGDYLHHKFAIVDEREVITGSQNWSLSANHDNDESLIIIESPTAAAQYQAEFNRLYSNARLGLSPALRQQLTQAATPCL